MAIADTAPDVIGSVAEAWKIPDELLATPTPACVAAWLIHAPGQSPAWEWYALVAIHLRPEPGLPDPVLHRPGVTHELSVLALESYAERMDLGAVRAAGILGSADVATAGPAPDPLPWPDHAGT